MPCLLFRRVRGILDAISEKRRNEHGTKHDWRKLKWPFCVTFSYYALLCLYTGSAEASEAGFLAVLIIALLIDAVAYACYLFFLSKAEENMGKLWFAFILAYVLASSDKLAIVWQMLAANAGTH